ncbi:MAG: XdhC family protein [Eubacteriales bacterium]|nr:XdhC family protein [Eubacteriales bacterium]
MKTIYEKIRDLLPQEGKVSVITRLSGAEGSVKEDMHRTLLADFPQETIDARHRVKVHAEADGDTLTICEPVLPKERLIVLGGGHISLSLCEFAAQCGFEVHVCDDRPAFANTQRFPHAAEVICDSFENAIRDLKITSCDYVVIVTRGHTHDADCLRVLLPGTFPAYLGLIGSRRRVGGLFDMLEEEGLPRELMDRICTPIGLSIGAVTPEEISISILAELIAWKRQPAQNTWGQRFTNASDLEPEIIDFLAEDHRPKAIVTIIKTKGSTPREAGAKMSIDQQGHITGSIGGGCSEGAVIRDAIDIIGSGRYTTAWIDLRGEVAASDGMVCGGLMQVLIEDGTENDQ